MSYLSVIDGRIESFITVLALDVTDFIWRPHDGLPVRLVIFQEDLVVVWVLPQSNNNVFLVRLLAPLSALEGEDLQSSSDIQNGSLFSG